MRDPRYELLAKRLLGHSVALRRGERVLFDLFDIPDEMASALVRETQRIGGYPYVSIRRGRVERELALGADESGLSALADAELHRMRQMQAYIAIRGSHNITEMSDVPAAKSKLVSRVMRPVTDYRVNHTRWCVLRWPTPSMAQQAGMSTEAFEDFYFDVCTMDYSLFKKGMAALARMMTAADEVRIEGPGTSLRFSLKGIPAIPCGGSHNIPDGEVFSCPVKNSVEGYVTFNTPTIYQGHALDNVRLEFSKGRIVRATGSDTARVNAILDSDEGARFIGEFALGFNPFIKRPMRDILFDEKIAGSFHFTPGQAYESADNGNRSQIHWDLVCIQTPEYGGGTIHFDGKLIRKDGLFVPPQLQPLNPENLLKEARAAEKPSGASSGKGKSGPAKRRGAA